MGDKEELLAFCGFYCGDCLGYTCVIAKAATTFMNVLEKYKFNRTAKSVLPEKLKGYDRFSDMLKFMTGLKCDKICRKREDNEASCEVRRCCRSKEFYACYECDGFETCEKLKSIHGELHYVSSLKNLKAIRKMGLKAWITSGKRHCYWNE